MKITYDNVLEKLVEVVPELIEYENYVSVKEEGSADLPYVVFGVFENFFKKSFKEHKDVILNKISEFLEYSSSSDDDKVKELVMFGFMETLYGNYEDFDKDMLDYFGEKTKQVLIDAVEHNTKIGMDDKDKVYKLFGNKLVKD